MPQRTLEQTHRIAQTHLQAGRPVDAEVICRQALETQPDDAGLLNNLGLALKDQARLEEATDCFRRVLATRPEDRRAYDNLLYTLIYDPRQTRETLRHEHRLWAQRHALPLRQAIVPHANSRDPDRRLRIGYVSCDFRNHPVAHAVLPLLENHDRAQFELYAYADLHRRPDAFTERIKACMTVWREATAIQEDGPAPGRTKHLGDSQLAELIRQDRIDILVDLTLHMPGNRLLVFARQPAPVQFTAIGYPGTTGLETIACRITDGFLDPPGPPGQPEPGDAYYSEHSIRLTSFWCFDPIEDVPVNPLPAGRTLIAPITPITLIAPITFGCLNNFCKLNVPLLQRWARVLRAVPESRMIIHAGAGGHRQWLLDTLAAAGVGDVGARVEFVDRLPRREFLTLHHRIDLMLDTSPYNGHTTTFDALWMGVPVVSLAGPTVVARAGLSMLSNVGLPELVAHTEEDFVSLAVELAQDRPRLAELRRALRQRLIASPLMDGRRYAREMEAAYRRAWRQWCGVDGTLSEVRQLHSRPEWR